jgi:hypothetical protein
MPQYITVSFSSCRDILLPSEVMEMNVKLEQVDKSFLSSVEQSPTAQVRVTNSDHDEKVRGLRVFTVGSSD